MGGIEFNGVNGSNGVFGSKKTGVTPKTEKSFDFGFNAVDVPEVGFDVAQFSTKPAFKQTDLDQMWAMAGITKPEGVKPLESTMAFAAEGAEYGVEYSEEDMNLARFMFENMQQV